MNTSLPSLHNGHLSEAAADVLRSAKWSSRDLGGLSPHTRGSLCFSQRIPGMVRLRNTHTQSRNIIFLETNDVMSSSFQLILLFCFSGKWSSRHCYFLLACFFFSNVLIHPKRRELSHRPPEFHANFLTPETLLTPMMSKTRIKPLFQTSRLKIL